MSLRRVAVRVTLVTILACAIWGWWLEPSSLRVKEVELSLNWPYRRPLRLALVSDLHVGSPYHGIRRLPETVARINSTRPDLVVIAGDLIVRGVLGGTFVPPEPIARALSHLQAPAGVVAVLGNHERMWDPVRTRRALESAGIRVLEDTAVRVVTPSGPMWIAGVSDFWLGPHDIPRALAAVTDPELPIILVTHNPDIFPDVPDRVMLTLAGHTHGGQVKLPLLGAPVVPSRFGPRYAAGAIVEDGRHLFVSTGIGTSSLPVRFGVSPTIFVLRIRGARDQRADSGAAIPDK